MSQVLLHVFVAWFYVKFVAHNTCWYARHLFRGKSEDVMEFSDGSYDVLLDYIWKIFSNFDLFPLEYLYLLVSFHWVRPFVRVGVVHIHTHDSWRPFFPISFGGDDGSSSLQGVDEALSCCYLVSLKDAHLSVVLLELQQELMRKDYGFDLVDEWESHNSVVGECQIHHRESYGH